MINFEPHEEDRAMETYHTWVRLIELLPYYSWIIDRFHISTRLYQWQAYSKNYDFSWLEERLHALGFHLVFCIRTPESFAAAREERLNVSGNPSQYDDLQRFIEEQQTLRKLVDQSILPTLVLDISDNNIARATDKIADWLEETGGLRAK
ncbi:MAG: hypothetical protein GWO41_11330 [candidate division Zixibacteria bacterium]|nr:hypothetical protein [candidate division Zixibacteria bacterium]NIW41311.1 hypothetical protein [candidate division Zixibacteria bacterium]NIX55096.1 hypothetical protein [candidate division Zixibacteria bacterium]